MELPSPADRIPGRSQSASYSSVRFAHLTHRPSLSSLRSLNNTRRTSPLNISTLPSKPPAPSAPMTSSPSSLSPPPATSPPVDVLSPLSPSLSNPSKLPAVNNGFDLPSPSLAGSSKLQPEKIPSFPPYRRTSQDRRVRSENVDHRTGRSSLLLPNGKRPALVTGGYETSSEEDGSSPAEQAHSFRAIQPSLRLGHGVGIHAVSDQGRRRAQTLMSPTFDEYTNSGNAVGVAALGIDTMRKSVRRLEEVASRRNSRELLRSPPLTNSHRPSRISSQRSTKSGQALSTSRSDSFFPQTAFSGSSRTASTRTQPMNLSASRGIKERERREDDLSSPEGSRKGKRKEKDRQIGGLAASLGLNGAVKDVVLSPDQINNLLNDTDVANALRMINNNPLITPRISSSFSPASTRPGSPAAASPPPKPFLVSAPSALTGDVGLARDRTVSESNTVASSPGINWDARMKRSSANINIPTGQSLGDRRRRADSGVATTVEGGHVPFTHYVPVVTVDERSSDSDSSPAIEDGTPPIVEAEGSRRDGSTKLDIARKGKERGGVKRGRLSHLFSLKPKRSAELALAPTVKIDTRSDDRKSDAAKDKSEHARIGQAHERDLEMRRKEKERRENELAQERRYRALTQIAAHPASERMAYRTSSHLQAFYNHVYEGIEDPPKMNPLAVLRWRIRTDEQKDFKAKWDAKQVDEKNCNKSSPALAVTKFGDTMHSSPVDMRSLEKFGNPRRSSESGRPNSFEANRYPSPRRTLRDRFDPMSAAKGWRYSIDDVAAYKASDGVINYFIPPREAVTDDNTTGQPGSQQYKMGEGSSAGGSMIKDNDIAQAKTVSASAVSLNNTESKLIESPDVRLAPLSRSTSIETGERSVQIVRDPHVMHWAQHGAGGPHLLTHALKMPFEKLGSAARKQRILGVHGLLPHNEASDSQHESPVRNEPHPPGLTFRPRHPPVADGSSQSHLPAGPARLPERQYHQQHQRQRRMRGSDGGEGPNTDEERVDREFHLRKLFFKGQRAHTYEDRRITQRSDASEMTKGGGRQAELRHLESAWARESTFRERQAETTRRSQLESETKDRIRQVEAEIYEERLQQVSAARRRLDTVNLNIERIDDSMRHYLSQIDQMRTVAKVSAEVDTVWPELERLQAAYLHRRSADGLGENQDVLSGLRGPRDDSPALDRRSVTGTIRSQPKRKGTLSTPLPPLYNSGINPWPRRSSIDSTGTSRVNPIHRVELTLNHARSQGEDMFRRGGETTRELQSMIGRIDALIRQKDAVRSWTKAALEQNRSLQHAVDSLHRKIRGDSRARMGRLKDRIYDTLVRRLLSPLFRGVFGVFYIGRWIWSLRSSNSRQQHGVRGLKDAPWGVWGFATVIVALVGFFYYFGGEEGGVRILSTSL